MLFYQGSWWHRTILYRKLWNLITQLVSNMESECKESVVIFISFYMDTNDI